MNPILELFRSIFGDSRPVPPAPTGNYPNSPAPLYNPDQQTHIKNMQDISKSSLADTLQAILGSGNARPNSPISMRSDLGPGVVGANSGGYLDFNIDPTLFNQTDKRNNTPASAYSPRTAYIHERAHNADGYHGSNALLEAFRSIKHEGVYRPSEKELEDYNKWTATGREKEYASKPPLEKAAIQNIDPYYNQSLYKEHGQDAFAQAFVNAFQFLQDVAKKPDMDWREYISKLEGNTPGSGAIMIKLLRDPIYSKHPLQALLPPEEKKK